VGKIKAGGEFGILPEMIKAIYNNSQIYYEDIINFNYSSLGRV